MKVLVTGATGFIGRHVRRELARRGHAVWSLARGARGLAAENASETVVVGDLASSSTWVPSLPEDLDAVIHCAGLTHAVDVRNFHEVNAEGTRRLASALAERFTPLRFIHVSSLAAAGPATSLDRKEHAGPISAYGHSKLAGEKELRAAVPPSWEITILRPPMVIGSGDAAFKTLARLLTLPLIFQPGGKAAQRFVSFIAVSDLADFISLLLRRKGDPIPFPLYPAHRDIVSLKALALAVRKAHRLSHPPLVLPTPLWLVHAAAQVSAAACGAFGLETRFTPDKVDEVAAGHWVCDPTEAERQGLACTKNLDDAINDDGRG